MKSLSTLLNESNNSKKKPEPIMKGARGPGGYIGIVFGDSNGKEYYLISYHREQFEQLSQINIRANSKSDAEKFFHENFATDKTVFKSSHFLGTSDNIN